MSTTQRQRSDAVSDDGTAEPDGGAHGQSIEKPRSCATCRARKVRCDKMSPCSNCRRARIPCVLPSPDKIPRWAHRIERASASASTDSSEVGHVLNRLRSLEGLVKDLGGQLEHMQAGTKASPTSDHQRDIQHQNQHAQQHQAEPATSSSEAAPSQSKRQVGRLVADGASQSRYVSTRFWTRVNDEVRMTILQSLSSMTSIRMTPVARRIN